MSAHDPLCSWHGTATKPPGCDCALIAQIAADTRAKIAAEIQDDGFFWNIICADDFGDGPCYDCVIASVLRAVKGHA